MLTQKCIYKPLDEIKRGDIIFTYIGNLNVKGSEQKGDRPYLVIQNNTGNRYSNTIIAVPITNEIKKDLPTHMKLREDNGVNNESLALFEQIRTIDKCRLGFYLGHLDEKQMLLMDKKLRTSLSL